MAVVGGLKVAPERVRPSYLPILRAHVKLVEEGKPPTYANIGREVGVHRNAISQMFQRHPDLAKWIAAQIDASVGHFVPSVLQRHAMLGIQGSVDSAKLYLTAMGTGGFARSGGRLLGDDDDENPEDSRFTTTVNILVPHPQLPNGGRMPALGAHGSGLAPGVPNLADIPVVTVR